MDDGSRNIIAFLEGVQAARTGLRAVWGHYTRLGLPVSSTALTFGPVWALDGYFDLGLTVIGADGRSYELSARLRWSDERWMVQADVSREEESASGERSYPVLRELPERRATDWPTALEYLHAAVAGLMRFDDVIPGGAR